MRRVTEDCKNNHTILKSSRWRFDHGTCHQYLWECEFEDTVETIEFGRCAHCYSDVAFGRWETRAKGR